MNQLQVYSHNDFGNLEAILIDGKPYFPATRSAEMLGYTNPYKAISDHCRYLTKREVPHPQSPDKLLEINFIPQGDLIRLITHSKLPTALVFESWVFDEVVPSVLNHGVYAVDKLLEDPDMLIAALQTLKAERAKIKSLEETVGIQTQQIAEMTSKASYFDIILNCVDAISITQIAKDYGKSAIWLNSYLHDKGVQFKQGDIWLLYQKYAEQGYTCTKTHNYLGKEGTMHAKVHTYYTQKGRLFLYGLLKEDGILPLMEREQLSEIA